MDIPFRLRADDSAHHSYNHGTGNSPTPTHNTCKSPLPLAPRPSHRHLRAAQLRPAARSHLLGGNHVMRASCSLTCVHASNPPAPTSLAAGEIAPTRSRTLVADDHAGPVFVSALDRPRSMFRYRSAVHLV